MLGFIRRFKASREPLARLVSAGRAEVGFGSYGNPKIAKFAFDDTRLLIGKYSSIGARTLFVLGGEHPTRQVSTYPFRIRFGIDGAGSDGHPYSKGDITVGNDVWIGTRCTILSGVRVGDGAVVGAGSVVVRDVPPYAIVGGNPAKVVRYRYSDTEIDKLLEIRWWDWDASDVLARVDELNSESIDSFLRKYG